MTKSIALIVVLAAAAGCGRPSDVARMQSEAEGVVSRARPEVAELEHRIAILTMRGPSYRGTPDYQKADFTIGEAKHELDLLKAELARRPAEIAAAANAQDDVRAITEHLQMITDNTRESVRTHLTVATADVATGETWLARAADAPAPVAPVPPPATEPVAPPSP